LFENMGENLGENMATVAQFSKILNETSDLETLQKCQELVSNRIEVVSNSSSASAFSEPPIIEEERVTESLQPHVNEASAVAGFVDLCPQVMYQSKIDWLNPELVRSIDEEVSKMFRSGSRSPVKVQYRWLSSVVSTYNFGSSSLKSMVMERLLAINQLVAELNKQLDCKFNSCLISHYTS
jgi:hypothetical protein